MSQIDKFNLTKLLSSASLEFHELITGIISGKASVVSILGSLFADYKESVRSQWKASGKNPRLVNTDEVEDSDKQRDVYVNRFFKTISEMLKSPDEDERNNAKIIENVIAQYRGLSAYERNKETAEIKKMITALRPQPIMEAVLNLSLDGLLEKIDDANYAFINAMNVRFEGEEKRIKTNAREQRKVTEKLYAEVVTRINAFAIATPSADLESVISGINAVIEQYSRIISHMRAGGSGNEKLPKKSEEDSIEN